MEWRVTKSRHAACLRRFTPAMRSCRSAISCRPAAVLASTLTAGCDLYNCSRPPLDASLQCRGTRSKRAGKEDGVAAMAEHTGVLQ